MKNPARCRTKYSVVIPVYNSSGIVETTVNRVMDFFNKNEINYEIILVNDGSTDSSWNIIKKIALNNKNIVAINLIRNFGQHNANMAGFNHATGEYIITMDDDLQNPPEEIIHLINKANEGHDLVIGRFRQKKHAFYRKLGTRVIGYMNEKVFHKDKDLVLSNFRIIHRSIIDRVCEYKTSCPYIPGLLLMFSVNQANVPVEHHERAIGKSNYNFARILKLVATILFNYSSYPLKFISILGLFVSFLSFFLGVYYLGTGLIRGVKVPGWTTITVLISFFNGIIIMSVSMIGEYIVRLLNQSSSNKSYYIQEVVRFNE